MYAPTFFSLTLRVNCLACVLPAQGRGRRLGEMLCTTETLNLLYPGCVRVLDCFCCSLMFLFLPATFKLLPF